MKAQFLFCNVLAIALLTGGPALAQAPVGLNSKTLPTDFSGKGASEKRTLSKSYSANGAITGLTADEDFDHCYLELKYVDVVTRQAQSSIKFADCAGKDGNPKDGAATARRDINLTGGRLATGVRVVLNKDGDKIKGIQLLGNFGECVLGTKEFTLAVSDCSSVLEPPPIARIPWSTGSATPAPSRPISRSAVATAGSRATPGSSAPTRSAARTARIPTGTRPSPVPTEWSPPA